MNVLVFVFCLENAMSLLWTCMDLYPLSAGTELRQELQNGLELELESTFI